jgi:hypothetical protein
MAQVANLEGIPSIFVIKHDDNGAQWLRACRARSDDWCPLNRKLLFRLCQ